MTKPEQFEQLGCLLVKNFLDPLTVQIISMYMENKLRREEWIEDNNKKASTKYGYYADPLIEVVLNNSLKQIADICGKELEPTYSYMRVYQPGEQLKPHVDRPSCEISVTVNVASKGPASEIWMHYKDNEPHAYILNPGDAAVYKGKEVTHWRDPLKPDQLNVQFMLHYVDKNGPHAERKFDTRPALGYPSNLRRS